MSESSPGLALFKTGLVFAMGVALGASFMWGYGRLQAGTETFTDIPPEKRMPPKNIQNHLQESFGESLSEADAEKAIEEASRMLEQIDEQVDQMLGTVEEARKRFKANPRDKDALTRLGLHFDDPEANQVEKEAFYKKAVRANPGMRDLVFNLYSLYEIESRWDDGIAFFSSLDRKNEDSPDIDAVLSDLYAGKGDYPQAAEAAMTAARKSEDPLHEIQAAHYMIDLGRRDEASSALDRAEKELQAAAEAGRRVDARLRERLMDQPSENKLDYIYEAATKEGLAARYASVLQQASTEFHILRTRVRLAEAKGDAKGAEKLIGRLESRMAELRAGNDSGGKSFSEVEDTNLFLEREAEKVLRIRSRLAH